jgi:hypothetical protein
MHSCSRFAAIFGGQNICIPRGSGGGGLGWVDVVTVAKFKWIYVVFNEKKIKERKINLVN